MITKPQNVLVMRDVACAGYVAGGNTQFFSKDGDAYSIAKAATNMAARLSFQDDVGARYGSMLSFPSTAQQITSGNMDTVISITTRMLPWDVSTTSGGHASFPGGEQVYKEYASKMQLRSIHFGEDMKAAENQDFISQVSLGFKPQPLWPTDAPCSLCVRARPTTPLALLDPTACTTRSRSRS